MVFVRNVKFSAAECNSFNMRKKNVVDLASKKISGGSHAKKQALRCKVATFGVQSYTHQDAKLQLSECKVTTIKMQFQIFFGFNLKYLLSINGGFLIGNIYAFHQIALRSSPNRSPLKTAYLYSLTVYLCNFDHFHYLQMLKYCTLFKRFFTF